MTKIKLCGLSRECDIYEANILMPEFIGFVFYNKSKRFVTVEKAKMLKEKLCPDIKSVGVFVNEHIQKVVNIINESIIDIVQLHGNEDEEYISSLRKLISIPIIKAFSINSEKDVQNANNSSADYVLLDCGSGGTGKSFDWTFAAKVKRQYFLAGGLNTFNVAEAIEELNPYAVDVSSGIESAGLKDKEKMKNFVYEVRKVKS